MSEEKKKIIKESWEDSFPSSVKITVKVDGKLVFVKKGGEKPE